MRGKKNVESDFAACLRNFEPQIGLFPIKIGAYGEALLDYFRVCPNAQNLEINWSKISRELSDLSPGRAIPQWVCSNYNNCNHNGHCHPPFRQAGTKGEYLLVFDRDYTVFVDDEAGGEKQRVQKSIIGSFLIGRNDKVLVSPSRLDKARTDCKCTQSQVANLSGLTKQAISRLNSVQEDPKQKLNCIATKNGMVTTKYSLCCLLAAIYEVTPGYLMGQTDDRDKDIVIQKVAYYNKKSVFQDGIESVVMNTAPIHEEYEVSPGLHLPIMLFSEKKRAGRIAADKIRGYSDHLDSTLLRLLELCEKIYYRPIPPEFQEDFRLLFEGLLDSTNIHQRRSGDS